MFDAVWHYAVVCEEMEKRAARPFVADPCNSSNVRTYFSFIKAVWTQGTYATLSLYILQPSRCIAPDPAFSSSLSFPL